MGDHVATSINNEFDSTTQGTFGRAVASYVNKDNFKYSLDTDMAKIVEAMQDEILDQNLGSSYKKSCSCGEKRNDVESKLVNKSDMSLTSDTVNDALESFTESTGIHMTIIVDDIDDVFGRGFSAQTIFTLILAAGLIIFAIVLIVKAVKNKKNNQNNNQNNNNNQNYNRDWNNNNYNQNNNSWNNNSNGW